MTSVLASISLKMRREGSKWAGLFAFFVVMSELPFPFFYFLFYFIFIFLFFFYELSFSPV